jgi:hypothetical protein
MPFSLNSLVNVIFSIIVVNIHFYILLILGPSKELETFLDTIVSYLHFFSGFFTPLTFRYTLHPPIELTQYT